MQFEQQVQILNSGPVLDFDLTSPCTCWRKDNIAWSCASHSYVMGSVKSLTFIRLLCIKLRQLDVQVEVPFYYGLEDAYYKKDLMTRKFPRRSSCSEHTDKHLVHVGLVSSTSRNLSPLSVSCLNSQIYSTSPSHLLVPTPSGRWSLGKTNVLQAGQRLIIHFNLLSINSFRNERIFWAVICGKWITYYVKRTDYPSGFSQKIWPAKQIV